MGIIDGDQLTPRERMIAALDLMPVRGRIPNFELVFYLTMEAFGRPHPSQRRYAQWDQMTETERELHRLDMARLYVETCERFGHDGMLLHPNPGSLDETFRLIDKVRGLSGDTYFVSVHGDATYGIPGGKDMTEHAFWIMRQVDEAKEKAERRVDAAIERAEKLKLHGGLDGFCLCSDYCFNTNPFLPPEHFALVVHCQTRTAHA